MRQKEDSDIGFTEYLLTNYRELFAILILLPLSIVFNIYTALRNRMVFALQSAPQKHDERVKKIQREISEWKQNDASARVSKMVR